jgi:hypothetical protein
MSDKTQERRIADATTALEAFCPYYHGLAPSLAVLAKVAVRAADAPVSGGRAEPPIEGSRMIPEERA